MGKSYYENILAAELKKEGIPFEREFRFHPDRKWRSDFCIAPDTLRLLVEVEGGVWSGGRHTSSVGFTKDVEKYNAATILGFRLLRFTSAQVEDGTAINTIKSILGREEIA